MAPAAKNKISGGGQQKDNKSKKKNDANDDAEDTSKGGKGKSKLKPANSINVRHILVSTLLRQLQQMHVVLRCLPHSARNTPST